MTLFIDESVTAVNYTPEALCKQVFGYKRELKYITIHHWGAEGQSYDGVMNFLAGENSRQASIHFIAMDGRVNCLVSPTDVAWHAGNPLGQATSIGIECRPEATDGDYQTVAELVKWIRDNYGDLPLVPHNYWFNTSCPGKWDLDRIDRLARSIGSAPAPEPAPNSPALPPEVKLASRFMARTPETGDAVWLSDGIHRWHVADPKVYGDYVRLSKWGVLDIFKDGEVQNFSLSLLGAEVKDEPPAS